MRDFSSRFWLFPLIVVALIGCSSEQEPKLINEAENISLNTKGVSVKDSRDSGLKTFHGYVCTKDCSGHRAGYAWAEENGIDDTGDCRGNSNSFIEGCMAYVEELGN